MANMLDKKKKQQLIKKFKTHDEDTGSPQVQIAILTEEIKELTDHLKTHKKDFSSRRGLFRKVNLRRRLLNFLAKTEEKAYEELVDKLKLKKKTIITAVDADIEAEIKKEAEEAKKKEEESEEESEK